MGHHHAISQGPVSLWHQTIDMAAITGYAGVLVMQGGQCVFLNGQNNNFPLMKDFTIWRVCP